jgi:monofunctional biosynthetic peptidoglycan transglycosylase
MAATVYGKAARGQAASPGIVAYRPARHYANLIERGGCVTEPIVKPETEGLAMAAKRRTRSRVRPRPWLRRAVTVLAVLAVLPIVLTPLYLPYFVHPISTLMLKDLLTFQGYDRRWAPLDEIAPALANSVIMSEDGQFCAHRGVDLAELMVVIDDTIAGEGARGASTITMQTVKNLYLWHRPLGTLRKVVEMPLAVYADLVLPKRRIMEIYLNIAEWGPNIYGIEAAAQHHFGRSAKNLTRRQAALLAVTLPNPIGRNPAKPGPGLRRLASLIERRAAQAGDYVWCLK